MTSAGPLDGVRVLDAANVIAGPGAAARLGDFGAEIIKIEHPKLGDASRRLGWEAGGTTLWWKWLARNKQPITLDLSKEEGQDLFMRLIDRSDVLVESFRPGTLEKWNLAPERLLEANPDLIVLRISGFGQTGPYSRRPGFGTLAEAMSGFVHMNGFPDQPPLLPPIALADEVAGMLGAYAVVLALLAREKGVSDGQVIDLSLIESLLQVIGPVPLAYDQLGVVPGRAGSRLPYTAPRGVFRCGDDRWVAISGTAQSVAARLFAAIGRPELIEDERFLTNELRLQHVDELERYLEEWIGERPLKEVMEAFEQYEVAAAPVFDIGMVFEDEHYRERDSLVEVHDEQLGKVRMPAAQPRMEQTPGSIRHTGAEAGSANADVYGELGLSEEDLERLSSDGVI